MNLEKEEHGYIDDDKFYEKVGILDEEQLIAIGWDADNGYRICYSQLDTLKEFVTQLNQQSIQFIKGDTPKKYHIATILDSDDLEAEYCEEHKIDPDDEDRRVVAESIVNRIAFVNRQDYVLCCGDDNEDLYLSFVEEV